MSPAVEIATNLRIHVGIASSILEAGEFLSSALLISHGLRTNVVVAVRFRNVWIVAGPGGVRHLYPDAPSLEGWVRAVLAGKNLGARLVVGDNGLNLDLNGAVCVNNSGSVEGLEALAAARAAIYGDNKALCKGIPKVGIPVSRISIAPAVVNVIWDRRDYGLNPTPLCNSTCYPQRTCTP
ncbi:MAG: hypothetical protein F7B20_02635 [Aeropyrum sp.]|nr:hypothetical protein [Aeropyrum sp.]MCE4615544.1 hypothetical protein [Aeropyrum sp.]